MSVREYENKSASCKLPVTAEILEHGVWTSQSKLSYRESEVEESQSQVLTSSEELIVIDDKDIVQHEEQKENYHKRNQQGHAPMKYRSESFPANAVSRDNSRTVLDIFNYTKYTGNLAPLSYRFPKLKVIKNGMIQPEPGVKRLKGKLAKSVGNKIDGCDWFSFHPHLSILNPKATSTPAAIK